MTESINTQNETDVTDEGDTSSTSASHKGFIKPAIIAVVGAGFAYLAFKKFHKPVPRSERMARKVRKYVSYLEKRDFEFPELPPHVRKAVESRTAAATKLGRKATKDLTAKAHKAQKALSKR